MIDQLVEQLTTPKESESTVLVCRSRNKNQPTNNKWKVNKGPISNEVTVTKERKQERKEEEISTEKTSPVYLHHTAMFSDDSINHHFILIKASGDWNIDPCGEGKHPLGWLQQSVDSITHHCFFPPIFISWISIIIVMKEGCCLHTFSYPVFVQASNLHTIAGDWWHVKVKAAISLQQPRRNNINTNINFQLNCPRIAFCLPADRLFIAMLRRDRVCSSHTFVHQFLTDSRYETGCVLIIKHRAYQWNLRMFHMLYTECIRKYSDTFTFCILVWAIPHL